MTSPLQIITISDFNEFKYKEKKSIFIGQCYPVSNENDIDNIHKKTKKKYFDAAHHCYAYNLVDGQNRYSDDGEPTGTAGVRILNAISHFNLTNILVLVIRYFGGTKLGIGSLGKAYFYTAKELLETSNKITKSRYYKLKIFFPYELSNQVHKLLSQHTAKIIDIFFSPHPGIELNLKFNDYENFSEKLQKISYNKIITEIINDKIYI
ncbi:MAG: YigZ family protein [Ignavibacteriales bacterium]|nr:YigZ family protein [Ignavibacteriales bacterium]